MNRTFLAHVFCAICLFAIQSCATPQKSPFFVKPSGQILEADHQMFNQALELQKKGQLRPAILMWKNFLNDHPKSFEAHNNLAMAYFSNDQLDLAIDAFSRSIELSPENEKIMTNYRRALRFRVTLFKENKDYAPAVRDLEKIAGLSPKAAKRERIAAEIEDLHDLIYKQVERNNSLEDYRDYVERYPDSSNIGDARAKIMELESAQTRQMEKEQTQRRIPFPTMEEGEVNESGQIESSPIEDTVISQEEMENTGFTSDQQGEAAKEPMPAPAKEEALMVDPQPAASPGMALPQAPPSASTPASEAMVTPPPMQETVSPPPPEIPVETPEPRAMEPTPAPAPVVPAPPAPAATLTPSPSLKSEDVTSEFLQKKITELKRKVARAPTPSSGLPRGKKVKIATQASPLNVRLVPSIRGKIIGQAEKGAILPVLREKEKWYQVEYDKGKVGWISKLFSEPVE